MIEKGHPESTTGTGRLVTTKIEIIVDTKTAMGDTETIETTETVSLIEVITIEEEEEIATMIEENMIEIETEKGIVTMIDIVIDAIGGIILMVDNKQIK